MSLDIAALKRRFKPERRLKQLRFRPDDDLVGAGEATDIRRLLTDTTVYIHEWGGWLPKEKDDGTECDAMVVLPSSRVAEPAIRP